MVGKKRLVMIQNEKSERAKLVRRYSSEVEEEKYRYVDYPGTYVYVYTRDSGDGLLDREEGGNSDSSVCASLSLPCLARRMNVECVHCVLGCDFTADVLVCG